MKWSQKYDIQGVTNSLGFLSEGIANVSVRINISSVAHWSWEKRGIRQISTHGPIERLLLGNLRGFHIINSGLALNKDLVLLCMMEVWIRLNSVLISCVIICFLLLIGLLGTN